MGETKPRVITMVTSTPSSNPVDSETRYFGAFFGGNMSTTAAQKRLYVPCAGIITRVNINSYSATAGSAENLTINLRLNNTTDYLVATVAVSANWRSFVNNSMNVPVVVGDYFELKYTFPAWATNPADMQTQGIVVMECP